MQFRGGKKRVTCKGTGFIFSDRWRTLHTNVLQAGVTDSACQY